MNSATRPVRSRKAETALHVQDIMTVEPACVRTGDALRTVAQLLDEYEISGAPVVDDQDRLVGVVSRTDLVHALLEGPQGARKDEDWLDLLTADSARAIDVDAARLGVVDDVMSVDPVVARCGERLRTVARRMASASVHRVIVVDDLRRPVGIVTTLDLLRVFPE
jgi:predicted transcriptional regulator